MAEWVLAGVWLGQWGEPTSVIVLAALACLMTLVSVVGLWAVFEKAGHPGWKSIVPIYNSLILLRIVGRPAWWWVLLNVPVLGLLVWFVVAFDLARSFGRGVGFGAGVAFLGPIFLAILGFGRARYQRSSPGDGLIDSLTDAIGHAMFWLLLLMVLLGAGNALARSVGWSSNTLLEAQWYLFGTIFLLGAAHTLRRDAHVRVDVLYDRLSHRVRRWINLCGHTLLLLPFCAVMVWVSLDFVLDSIRELEDSPDPGGLPRYLIKPIIPLAFLLLGLQTLCETAHIVRALRTGRNEDVTAPDEGDPL